MELILPIMLATTPLWILLGCIIWQLEKIRLAIPRKRKKEEEKPKQEQFFMELEEEIKDGLTEIA